MKPDFYSSLSFVLWLPAFINNVYVDGSDCTPKGGSEDAKKWLKDLRGLSAVVTNGKKKFHVGICGDDDENDGISLVENEEQGKSSISIGKWSNSEIAASGEKWMTVILKGGDDVQRCTNESSVPRQGILLITCDHSVEKSKLSLVTVPLKSSQKYVFTLAVSKGCPAPSKPASSGRSTIGSIFLALILLVGAYFILGFLYKRFVLGARGFEQMPNYLFWVRMGRTVQDKFTGARTGSTNQGGYRGDYRNAANNEFLYDNPPLTVDSSVEEADGSLLGSDQYRPIPTQQPRNNFQPSRGAQEDDSDERLLQV